MPKHKPAPNRTVGLLLFVGMVAMLGLSYAFVPLYRMFCQTTGFGGTTQQAVSLPTHQEKRTITVRFNADVHRDMPWSFRPLQKEITVHAGEVGLAFYQAKNISNQPLVGMATYNVTPDKAGIYFHKVDCFCFVEQRLEAGQTMDMPVQFFIHPDIVKDPLMNHVKTITLSYTFFRFKK